MLKERWISQSLLIDLQPVNQCSLVNTCYDKVLTNELAAPLWLTAPKHFTESLQAAGKSSLSSAPQHKSSSCHTHPQWLQFTLLPAGVTKNILNLQIKELHLVQFSLLRCFQGSNKDSHCPPTVQVNGATYQQCWRWCVWVCWACCSWSWWRCSCSWTMVSNQKWWPRGRWRSAAQGPEEEEEEVRFEVQIKTMGWAAADPSLVLTKTVFLFMTTYFTFSKTLWCFVVVTTITLVPVCASLLNLSRRLKRRS